MKKIIFLLLSVLAVLTSNAQMPNGGKPAAAGKSFNLGRLYGKVYESSSKEPVGYASLVLLTMGKDSVISGGLTKENGDFSLENLPSGAFRLKISFLGYKDQVKQVKIFPPNFDQDLGNFYLETEGKVLSESVVTAEKDRVQMTIDRRVYNVDKDILAQNGTAADALKNVPAVTIDNDGNAQLRGGSPQIFVDGKPTQLMLNQIPSGEIDRIEVITNPSAKFDANTTSGILNIVLKKNQKPGISGMVSAGYGTNDRNNLMANLNIKQKPINFSISYNTNGGKNYNNGFTNRENFDDQGFTTLTFDQTNKQTAKNRHQFGRAGLEYYIDNRQSLTLSQNIMGGNFDFDETQNFNGQMFWLDSTSRFSGDRLAIAKNKWRNYTTELAYKRTFPTQGQELTASVQYSRNKSNNSSTFTTNSFDNSGSPSANNPLTEMNDGGQNGHQVIAQLDYIKPVGVGKIEIGVKTQRKINESFNDATVLDKETGTWKDNPVLALNYAYTDWVSGAYLNYANKLSNSWRYQAGLRMEYSWFEGEQPGTDSSFTYRYPSGLKDIDKSLFPAVYLSKTINSNAEMQLNFSRKLNRANFFQIMPFKQVLDNLNIRAGNPNLRPEFVNTVEANYSNTFKGGNLLTSVYLKNTDDPITNITVRAAENADILVTTFINGGVQNSSGWENTVKYKLFKGMDAMLNINMLYQQITATYEGKSYKNDGFSGTGKLNLEYKFAKNWASTLSGQYESTRPTPQGYMLPNYFTDFGLRREFGPMGSISLTVSDIFNTKRMASHLETIGLVQDIKRRRESRYIMLGARFMFGKPDYTLFKRRKPGGGEGMQGGGDMGY